MRPLLILLLSAALAACPKLPPQSGCLPVVQECRAGEGHTDLRPYVCSASQRWEPAGDLPCAAVGAVCVESDGGLAHCAAARDGGADAE